MIARPGHAILEWIYDGGASNSIHTNKSIEGYIIIRVDVVHFGEHLKTLVTMCRPNG